MQVDHCKSKGMTYWEHFRYAMKFGVISIVHGKFVILHAIFPWLFCDTVSKLYNAMTDMAKEQDNGNTDRRPPE